MPRRAAGSGIMAAIEFYSYEPAAGHALRHNPLNAIIAPRPIGWISTLGRDRCANLAPYSFFNAFNYDPPIVGFSAIQRSDSLRNASETREFVWNLVTRELGDRMSITAAPVASGVDEFELAGLSRLPSLLVDAPRVAESRASMECKVIDIVQYRGLDGELIEGWMVFGQAVAVHIDKTSIEDGIYQTAMAFPILRAGGLDDYVQVLPENMFQIARPPAASLPLHHGS